MVPNQIWHPFGFKSLSSSWLDLRKIWLESLKSKLCPNTPWFREGKGKSKEQKKRTAEADLSVTHAMCRCTMHASRGEERRGSAPAAASRISHVVHHFRPDDNKLMSLSDCEATSNENVLLLFGQKWVQPRPLDLDQHWFVSPFLFLLYSMQSTVRCVHYFETVPTYNILAESARSAVRDQASKQPTLPLYIFRDPRLAKDIILGMIKIVILVKEGCCAALTISTHWVSVTDALCHMSLIVTASDLTGKDIIEVGTLTTFLSWFSKTANLQFLLLAHR